MPTSNCFRHHVIIWHWVCDVRVTKTRPRLSSVLPDKRGVNGGKVVARHVHLLSGVGLLGCFECVTFMLLLLVIRSMHLWVTSVYHGTSLLSYEISLGSFLLLAVVRFPRRSFSVSRTCTIAAFSLNAVVVDSHVQRIVLATEETTVTQQVSHRPIKCLSRLWSQRGTKVNGSHHGDNPLLRPTGIKIATKRYSTLQAMAPTDIKTVHQTSSLHIIESNLDPIRIAVAYPRPPFSATNWTNYVPIV